MNYFAKPSIFQFAHVLYSVCVDLVFELPRETTREEINTLLREASENGDLKGILGYTEEPLVSGAVLFSVVNSTVSLV